MATTSSSTTAKKTRVKSTKTDENFYESVGRRRTAIARVRLYRSKKSGVTIGGVAYKPGDFVVNGKPLNEWTNKLSDSARLKKPLMLLGDHDQSYVVVAKSTSGGKIGQVDAIIHGLARALASIQSVDIRSKLKEHDLLKRDDRTRERRKVGTGGKARRLKQSPKR